MFPIFIVSPLKTGELTRMLYELRQTSLDVLFSPIDLRQ